MRSLTRGPLGTLVSAQALSQAGDGLAQVAFAQVVLFEVGRGVTPAELAGLLAATLLPFSIVGPVAGVVIDRWDRRRVMTGASYARAVVAVSATLLLVYESVALAYVGLLLLLSSSRFVLAAKGAALPHTVSSAELVEANAVSSLAGLVSVFAGATVGSTFVASVPTVGFLAAAGSYLLAGARFRRLPEVGGGEGRGQVLVGLRRAVRDMAAGVRAMADDPRLWRPLVAVWAHRFLLGGVFIVLVLVADTRYALEAPGYGLALAATGVGAVLGTVLTPRLSRWFGPTRLLPGAFGAASAPALVAGLWTEFAVLVGGLGVTAVAFQVLKVSVDALVQEASDDWVRGRVFAAYDVLYNVAFVVAALALIPLWREGRARVLFFGLALAFVAVGVLVARWQRTPRLGELAADERGS